MRPVAAPTPGTPREPTPPASLVAVQVFLSDVFRRPTALAADPELARACAVHVAGNERLTPAEQVDIYRRQYWLRHDESLREDFPALAHVLGDELFDAFVRDYLTAHPPTAPNLRDLGAAVSAFLATWPKLPASRATLAREAAAYELAFVDVFDGADPPPLDPERLTALPPEAWETATIVLSPLVKRLRFEHPVHRLRILVREANERRAEHEHEHEREPDIDAWIAAERRPVHLALFRKELVVHFEDLAPEAFAMLEALGAGCSLLAACAKIAEGKSEDEARALATQIGDWFRRWASWGFVADVVLAGDPR